MRKILFVFVLVVCCSAFCFSQNPPRAAEPSVVMRFPPPQTNGRISLEQAIENRRSMRQFTEEPLTITQLGQLCWAAQGITDPNKGLRTAPSAGALYPIELYVLLPDGLYLYQPASHELSLLINSDLRQSVFRASFNQRVVQNARCTFIIAGNIKKIEARYRNRGEKFTYLETGHIAQNIQLQAVAIGLGSAPIGVIDAKTIAQICKMPQGIEVLYLIPVGNPTEKPVLAPAVSTAGSPVIYPPALSADLRSKRVAIIVPSRYFNDSDFYGIQQALIREGIQPVIAGTDLSEVRGIEIMSVQRNIITPTILVRNLKVEDYDAFVFIGGTGIGGNYYNNRDVTNLVRSANAANKILAAIADAPAIFANAGIVNGKNVTSSTSQRYKMTNAGANWQRNLLITDGNLITAGESVSPSTTEGSAGVSNRFGTAVIDLLRRHTTGR